MRQFSLSSFSYLFFFLSINLLHSLAADDNSLYTNFLQCVSKSNINNTNNIIYSKQNSPQYSSVLNLYIRNLRFTYPSTPKPVLIITPRTASDVSAAVTCSRALSLHVRLRSGGHDFEGSSYTTETDVTNFVIIDMSNMRAIRVDPVAQTAYVEAGATLGELYYRIQQKSQTLGFPAGVCPTVGVGGHVSGGGYGNMIRKYGITIDHVIDAVLVGPDGRVYNNRSEMGEDLFWAIRGGGGASFGVVVSFTVGLVQVPTKVTVFDVMRIDNAVDLVYKWQFVMQRVDPNLFIRLLLQPVNDPRTKTKTRTLVTRVTFIGMFLGDSKTLLSLLNSTFPELGITKTDCSEMSWAESLLNWANYDNGTPLEVLLSRNYTSDYLKRKSDYVVQPISKTGLGQIMSKLAQIGKPGFVFNPYGGRMSEIPASQTAFPHRAGNLFKIQYSTGWKVSGKAIEDTNIGLMRELYSFMTPYVSSNPRGAYLNYRDYDIGVNINGTYVEGQVYGRKYFLGNFDRLVKIKGMVDPNNFFSYEQSIPILKSLVYNVI